MINLRKFQTVFIIVISNSIPLAGVTLWQWNAFQIIFLYWVESAVVGLYAYAELFELEDSFGMPEWTISQNIPVGVLFAFLYVPLLLFYFFLISRFLEGTAGRSVPELLRPFIWPAVLFALSSLFSYGLRYKSFKARVHHEDVSAFKFFWPPFFRFFLVHILLVTSVYWIYFKHATTVYFFVTFCVKSGVDFILYRWHEAHIPPVIKDREFFGV